MVATKEVQKTTPNSQKTGQETFTLTQATNYLSKGRAQASCAVNSVNFIGKYVRFLTTPPSDYEIRTKPNFANWVKVSPEKAANHLLEYFKLIGHAKSFVEIIVVHPSDGWKDYAKGTTEQNKYYRRFLKALCQPAKYQTAYSIHANEHHSYIGQNRVKIVIYKFNNIK